MRDMPTAGGGVIWPYVYRWKRHGRKGQWCLVWARADCLNSVGIEFPDGYRLVTSGNALMKRRR